MTVPGAGVPRAWCGAGCLVPPGRGGRPAPGWPRRWNWT